MQRGVNPIGGADASARRFAVLQPGARLHYAVPAVLARAGRLARLYTDAHARSALPFRLLELAPRGSLPGPLARLAGRRLPPELEPLTISLPWATLAELLARKLRTGGGLVSVPGTEARLRRTALARNFDGAGGLYVLSNGDLDLVREAKRRGLFVAYEQIINPHVGRILREERARHPDLEPQDTEAEVEEGLRRDEEVWRLADVVLGASGHVRGEILEHGVSAEKVRVVPYGIGAGWLELAPRPVPGRVLFVGSVGLRKGVHVLAAASRELRRRGVQHELRVVGPIELAAARAAWSKRLASPEFESVTYLGQVPRAEVRAEFAQADIFVLPTLSDSFALVHLEAMACGVPVVTTPSCGSTVRDGLDGFIVGTRDAIGLADRIEALISDRALRERCSRNARARASEFTWDSYAQRLLGAVSQDAF
ncbi:MAG: glycosyltransferase family 4 protein [Anaeromyxobacteraceae bacterium]